MTKRAPADYFEERNLKEFLFKLRLTWLIESKPFAFPDIDDPFKNKLFEA